VAATTARGLCERAFLITPTAKRRCSPVKSTPRRSRRALPSNTGRNRGPVAHDDADRKICRVWGASAEPYVRIPSAYAATLGAERCVDCRSETTYGRTAAALITPRRAQGPAFRADPLDAANAPLRYHHQWSVAPITDPFSASPASKFAQSAEVVQAKWTGLLQANREPKPPDPIRRRCALRRPGWQAEIAAARWPETGKPKPVVLSGNFGGMSRFQSTRLTGSMTHRMWQGGLITALLLLPPTLFVLSRTASIG